MMPAIYDHSALT